MSATERTASRLKKLNERIYIPRHEYRQVDAKSFHHLDLNFYDEVRDAFVAKGCRWLADLEDVTLKGTANDFRTFIRLLVSADSTVCIGLYQPKPRIWIRLLLWIFRIKIGKTVDCESELSGGRFIVTSNGAGAGKLNPPPGFDMKYFPVETEPDIIFRAHTERLKTFLAANPEAHASEMPSMEQALEMQHRMEAAKAAFRKGIGYVTEDELQRLGADSRTAADIKQAMNHPEGRV